MTSSLFSRPFLLLCLKLLTISTVASLFFPLQGYLASLGIPASAAGFILGADALAALLLQPFFTPFITARTARRWLLAGSLLLALALLLEGTVTGAVGFIAARMLHGIGFICMVAALMPLFVLCIPREMSGRAFGWISLLRLAPYAAVPPLFDLLKIAPADLGVVVRWSALLALATAALLWLLPRFDQESAPPVPERDSFKGVRQSLADTNILLLLLASALLYAGYSMVFFFLKGFGSAQGLLQTGLFFTVATVMMMAVRLLGGPLFDRFDKRRMNGASLAFSAVAVALLSCAVNSWWLMILALLCGLGWGVCMPLLNALLFDISPVELRGLNQNLALLMLQAGFFLGPFLGGLLLGQGGYLAVFVGSGLLFSGAAGLVFAVRNRADD